MDRFVAHVKAFDAALDRAIWGALVPDKDGRVSETERALSTVRGFATLGLVAVALFGWMASPKDGSLRGAATALLAAMAAFGAGGLMGFFFGLPRWSADSAPPRKPATGGAATDADAADESRGAIVHNTNLHRVIEWLTTLIVGLGLVHLKEAIRHATMASRWLTGEIVAPKDPLSVESGTPGAAILLTYAIAGFFLVFLWTVRYMGREIRDADNDMRRMEKVLAQTKTQMNSIIAAQATGATTPPAPPAAPAPAPAVPGPAAPRQAIAAFAPPPPPVATYQPETISGLSARNISQDIVADLNLRYSKSSGYNYEPLENFGPRDDIAAARRLEASVVEMGPGLAIFEVTLRVVSTAAQARPLAAEVIFLLHHTLPPVARVVQPHNGVAELKVQCIGSFVAGAVIAGEPTRLSFDLSALPNANRDFIEG